MELQNRVAGFIAEHRMLVRGDRVLVAVSGGPDSVALLHLLCALGDELGLQLEVAHVEHGVRGEAAQQDARFVAELAEKLKLPLHLKNIDVPRIKVTAGKGNLEALAREERYRFFAQVAQHRNVDKVATAHTQDDQAETVLMWFLRGSGVTGLSGISPIRALEVSNQNVVLIRPMLGVSKNEVLEFLKEKRIDYRLDRTNQDTKLLRNWIRQLLLPKLKERVDAKLPSRLAYQAELIRAENAFLEGLAQKEFARMRGRNNVDRQLFLKQAKAMQRRILRLWIRETRGHLRGIDFVHIDQLLKLIADKTPQSRLAIPGGWDLLKEYETLRLEKRSRSSKQLCYNYELHIGTTLNIWEAGVTIHSEYIAAPLRNSPEDFSQAVFDAAALPATLLVRNFRRGDRFRPLGMTGHKKIKDLFIEKKVPLSVRQTLPLLSTAEEIIWVPGYGRSESGRIHAQTSSIVRLRAFRLPDCAIAMLI